MNRLFFLSLLFCSLLAGCDKLDDGNDQAVLEVLPGTWAFSYQLKSSGNIGLKFAFEQVIFNEDGTCAITYIDHYEPQMDEDGNALLDEEGYPLYGPVYGALRGTYRASSALIRIDSSDVGGQEQVMIWRLVSFSVKQIVVEYEFEFDGQKVVALVTLDRI